MATTSGAYGSLPAAAGRRCAHELAMRLFVTRLGVDELRPLLAMTQELDMETAQASRLVNVHSS